MDKMVAFCGITCTDCKAFIATKENDDAKKSAVAEEWKIQPEEVNCEGCSDQTGRHINHWDTCDIRTCGTEKEVENCAYCKEYACEQLGKFHDHAPKAKETLDEIRK